MGETVAELAEEEADESRVIVRWIAATRGGTAEDDIVEVLLVLSSRTSEIWALRFVVEDGILVGNPYR